MKDYYEIIGNQIPYDSIQDFRLRQREYIYRPGYMEQVESGFLSSKIVYRYSGMIPYAAIEDESEYRSAVDTYKPIFFVDAICKDLIHAVENAFTPTAPNRKKYYCVNQAGRHFEIYLDDIPVLLVTQDGQPTDVYKGDERLARFGSHVSPVIRMIYVLEIRAKETYTFYGNGIQINDLRAAYLRLRDGMEQYREQHPRQELPAPEKKEESWFHFELPEAVTQLFSPSSGHSPQESELAQIKERFSRGEITEEEYRKLIDDVMAKL